VPQKHCVTSIFSLKLQFYTKLPSKTQLIGSSKSDDEFGFKRKFEDLTSDLDFGSRFCTHTQPFNGL